MKHPTKEECLKLLNEYGTPSHVRRHCEAVAATAYTIAEALNEHGFSLDTDLIMSAGMLHDIARTEDKHWEVGADYIGNLGFEEESKIIKAHMMYSPFSSLKNVTETDMVCLGDRLVKEDEYVGIDARIEYIIDKAVSRGHSEHVPHIIAKKKDTERFINEIENAIGITIDRLMRGEKCR